MDKQPNPSAGHAGTPKPLPESILEALAGFLAVCQTPPALRCAAPGSAIARTIAFLDDQDPLLGAAARILLNDDDAVRVYQLHRRLGAVVIAAAQEVLGGPDRGVGLRGGTRPAVDPAEPEPELELDPDQRGTWKVTQNPDGSVGFSDFKALPELVDQVVGRTGGAR